MTMRLLTAGGWIAALAGAAATQPPSVLHRLSGAEIREKLAGHSVAPAPVGGQFAWYGETFTSTGTWVAGQSGRVPEQFYGEWTVLHGRLCARGSGMNTARRRYRSCRHVWFDPATGYILMESPFSNPRREYEILSVETAGAVREPREVETRHRLR